MIDVKELIAVALSLQDSHPTVPARTVLDAVMMVTPGCELQYDPIQRFDTTWLDPRGPFGEMLREAFAPEIESDFVTLLDDPAPETRAVFEELWQRTVVERFGRAYLGWV